MVLRSIKNIVTRNSSNTPKEYKEIINALDINDKDDDPRLDIIWKAYQFASIAHDEQKRKSGEPYITHCAAVALILAEWHMDVDTIISGLLHDIIEDTEYSKDDIKTNFNSDVSELVEGVSKLSGMHFESRLEKQAENFMKMFLSVAKDIRVIIIKFADRLHNMRTLNHLSKIKQRRIAIETKDVYAPLAHRLGMNSLKIELENLVLKTVDPKIYNDIEKKLKTSKKQRVKYIDKFINPISDEINKIYEGMKIFGRAKHHYSIYGKMLRQNKKFAELYDLFAIRIITDKIEECYAILGIVHQLYTPMQERFKDYIATPKSNGYQSIHTTVFGADGKMVEVQIRTFDMDQTAEVGVAAHWVYKGDKTSKKGTNDLDRHMRWLRELVDVLQNEDKDPDEFLKLLKVDLFQDEIFVFTPNGDVIQLPIASTPVDFAFSVHTQVGYHCHGAKINNKIVPLNTELNNGDTIDILTSDSHSPSYSWLKFVKTAKAKSQIKKIVKKEQLEQSITLGREILEKTLRRMKKPHLINIIKKKPQIMGLSDLNTIYSELASGQITVRDMIEKYEPHDLEQNNIKSEESFTEKFINKARGIAKGIRVDGVSNTLIAFGKCCSPIPGDEIIGYITKGRGVTIHRSSCSNIPFLNNDDRFINVEWDVASNSAFITRLKIIVEDRKNILRDITEGISAMNMNIQSIDMKAEDGMGICILIIETRDNRQIERLKKKITQIRDVVYLERI